VLKGDDRTDEISHSVATRVAELLPRGELATLEGLGHDAPLRAPDVVAQRIIEFIDRIQARE
jgi:pimeloyl-ACP methyl ester carboxylesterase